MTLRFAGLVMALSALLLAPTCFAQETSKEAASLVMLKQSKASHPERVILAWYKTAGVQPEFAAWGALSPFLDKAKDSDIGAIINRETNRLMQAYNDFDVAEPLVVHTNVQLDDYSTINGVLTFNEFSAKTFFTYSLYGENVAVVPRDIKNFGTMPMEKQHMDDMLGKAGGSKIVAEILLRPTLADAKEPFKHDGRDYKLLLADIAEINFWTQGEAPELLWTWRADWYQPKSDKTLIDLKTELPVQP